MPCEPSRVNDGRIATTRSRGEADKRMAATLSGIKVASTQHREGDRERARDEREVTEEGEGNGGIAVAVVVSAQGQKKRDQQGAGGGGGSYYDAHQIYRRLIERPGRNGQPGYRPPGPCFT